MALFELPKPSPDAIIQELNEGEAIVYLAGQEQVHLLNGTAYQIYRACQKQESSAHLLNALEADAPGQGEEILALGLERLQQSGILEASASSTSTRREFVKRATIAASLAPIVSSSFVPSPAAAASCISCATLSEPLMTCNTCSGAGPCDGSRYCAQLWRLMQQNLNNFPACAEVVSGYTGSNPAAACPADVYASTATQGQKDACYAAAFGTATCADTTNGIQCSVDNGTTRAQDCDTARRAATGGTRCRYRCCAC